MQAITAAELFTAGERIHNPVLLIDNGRVAAAYSQDEQPAPAGVTRVDYPDRVLVPGLVDLHIHGSAGYDVMECESGGLHRMGHFLAGHGVTSFLATVVTSSEQRLLRAIEFIGSQILHWDGDGVARPIGIHLEGPCISPRRSGVHPVSAIQSPSIELFDRFYQAAQGTLRLITIAPELPGALDVIQEAVRRGVTVSIGHTDGTADDTRAAVAAGATHVTHTFNAMRPMLHRDPGVAGEALVNPRLFAEIIADGVHVDPLIVDVFLRAKGCERAVLVTDAISATGMGDGVFKLGPLEVVVQGNRAEVDEHLAGSVLTLDQAVRNAMAFANLSLGMSSRLASANAAAVIRETEIGTLRPGSRADLVVLSPAGEVVTSYVAGREVMRRA